VDRQTRHQEQAWTALRELVSKDNQVLGARLQGLQPSRKSVADSWEQLYPGKNARLARVMAETAPSDPRPFWKDADEVGPILEGKYMEATLVRNELPVQEAMRRAMAEIRTFYAARA
jgi:ABC-type glycerol-3-phosphate transport system substrate-binding protein